MEFRRPWIRLLVSAILIFHLVGVLLTPNPRSYINGTLNAIYRPYMNFLGLAHTWGFFAPEPVAPPMFIDYTLERKNATATSGRFPDEVSPFFFRDRQNRRMSLSRLILASDDNIRNMFVRYLCLKEKGVESLKLWRVMAVQPTLEMVQRGEKKMTDSIDFKIEVLGTYFCPEHP